MEEFNQILKSDLTDVEKLKETFDLVTGSVADHSRQEIELRRAMNDREGLVKEQIKLGVVQHIRGIFDHCYYSVTGRRAWDE